MASENPYGDNAYLTGQLLLAMPSMRDPRFSRSVIYMCAHGEDGAVGLVINRLIGALPCVDLLEQLGIAFDPACSIILPSVHFGGPVEAERGLVLHSTDYLRDDSMPIDATMALTATVDIVRDIAEGQGPNDVVLALGYAGWGPGQLDGEIQENAWLSVPSDRLLVFDDDIETKWDRAMAKIGVDAALLSTQAGRA
ncbi:YqgE/AlgH family protein [Alphaproteobacteria bacterium]|nr:YqgE/AlgH family protein [Alphaproteobacteria bacterium]